MLGSNMDQLASNGTSSLRLRTTAVAISAIALLDGWNPVPDAKSKQSAGVNDRRLTPAKKTKYKAGRNDPCPCGSGKKFKRCCVDA